MFRSAARKGQSVADLRFANHDPRFAAEFLTKALPAPLPRFQPSSLLASFMDMTFTPFGNRMDAAGGIRPDFRALVAFVAASQAAQPTGRIATRLALGGDRQMAATESLIALFAPRPRGEGSEVMGRGQALKGCFNPTVPISHIPLTKRKDW
ncbi:MAG: hypothetical protein ACTS1X_13865 [Parasphingopyxis sp.]|uniref:hypothetical protein n=1 Tax=Parasphingopyxis sp. TaxID=1920299 RepID=UPI003F9F8F2E